MAIETVTLLGADGRLGPAVLKALVESKFKVQVLKRESSKSTAKYPSGVTETRIPDDFPPSSLESALQGQDAVIVTIPGTNTSLQKKLADAAVKVGVTRFIPADFGSVDSDSQRARDWVPLYIDKYELRQYLSTLSSQNPSFSWTALVCGHFFDHDPLWLHIDIPNRKADILDAGDIPASACTMATIGLATANILSKADDEQTKNKTLYIQSFCATQMEIIRSFEKATGEKFELKRIDGMAFAEEKMKEMKAGNKAAMEDVVWVLGAYEADWRHMKGFANELLGLKEDSLDEICRKIVEEQSSKGM
ncbi:CipA protein [Venturia nashicola]|uniref:CipA protein n=1 Tax=Venturia nashicola TaxID=86259 RepID=A0A4Z1NGI0_9PEZI|nr:CipA protein [Venturia nashicola]TLD20851.1 CipA protein [Venturia nashicola]